MKYGEWFLRLEPDQEKWWGKEALALAQAEHSGASILPGFVVSTSAYAAYFAQPVVKKAIVKACKGLNPRKAAAFAGAAKEVRAILHATSFPTEVATILRQFYSHLGEQLLRTPKKGMQLLFSSAGIAEEQSSFTRQINTPADFDKALRQLYSLSFTEQALYRRLQEGKTLVPPPMAVIVQYVEAVEASGTAFCHDTETHDDTTIQIQATHLFSAQSDHYFQKDTYKVDLKSLALLKRTLSEKWWGTKTAGQFVSLLHETKTPEALNELQIEQLARQIKLAQSTFADTLSFSWVWMQNQFWLTRVSELTEDRCFNAPSPESSELPRPLLLGLSGNVGWVSGPVQIIKPGKSRPTLKSGSIVVVSQLAAADYQWLIGAAGLISEVGHSAGQEGQLARQLGIPAVSGVSEALGSLKNGQMVTVDGLHGAVYAGVLPPHLQARPNHTTTLPITATKIYSTILNPHDVQTEELTVSDGIGLLRGDYLLYLLGVEPEEIVRKKLSEEYTDILAEEISRLLDLLNPRPVIYQFHDLHSHALHSLRSQPKQRHEPNPALGYRGSHRLLDHPELLELELQALAKVGKPALQNLAVMMPMARTLQEVKRMQYALAEFAQKLGLEQLPLWVKCETPALLIEAEALCELGVAGLCLDIPSLSQFILGLDKENYQVGHLAQSTDEAILQAVGYAVSVAREWGMPSMLVAELERLRPEMLQMAIEAGATSISVAPSDLFETHQLVAAIERRILLDQVIENR